MRGVPPHRLPAAVAARKERAIEIHKGSANQSSRALSDSLLGDVIEVMIGDFVSIYQCARGHQIDPAYATALKHDILIALEATAKAEAAA